MNSPVGTQIVTPIEGRVSVVWYGGPPTIAYSAGFKSAKIRDCRGIHVVDSFLG